MAAKGNPRVRATRALDRIFGHPTRATVGWRKSETEVVIEVVGKPNYLYVTRADQTVLVARNEANVPHAAFYPVKIVLEGNTWVIRGRDNRDAATLTNLPDDGYGVATHPHALSGLSDVELTALADGEMLEWDATAGKWVNTVGGGAVDSVNGQTGVVVLDSDDIAEGASNLYLTQERVEDFVAAQLTPNSGRVQFSYDDGTGALTAILDVSAADRYLYSTGADAWAEGTITAFMRGLLDDADAATARTTLGLVIGTNVQAYDAELAALAGLTSAADRLPYFTGSGTASLATFTGAARNLLDDATAADMRTTLGVTVYDQETAEDIVGAMVSGNTETGISVTYDDGTGKLNFVVAAQDHGGLTGLSDDDHSIYLLLAGRSGGQRVTGIASTGYALEVYRDLASGSTDSPVFYVLQDNASDDQQAVWVKQDGTGTALVLERTNAGMLASFAGTYSLTEGSITFGTGFYRASGSNDQVTLSIIRGTAAETIYNAGVNGDSFRRLTILADGTFGWGPGSVTRDTFLSRLAGGGLLIQNSDGYKLFATRTGVNGTPQVIIPNGTGDVVRQLKVTMLANDGTNAGSREAFVVPGGTTTVTAGTTTATLTVNANGEVSIVRTAGAGTLTVTFDMFWQ